MIFERLRRSKKQSETSLVVSDLEKVFLDQLQKNEGKEIAMILPGGKKVFGKLKQGSYLSLDGYSFYWKDGNGKLKNTRQIYPVDVKEIVNPYSSWGCRIFRTFPEEYALIPFQGRNWIKTDGVGDENEEEIRRFMLQDVLDFYGDDENYNNTSAKGTL
jgi:hypothetical protein